MEGRVNAEQGTGVRRRLKLGEFLPYLMTVTAEALSQGLSTIYNSRFGVTIPEWRVLAGLSQRSPMSATELGAHTNMDKPRVSRALRRMESRGLLDRRTDPKDQRVAVLRLTSKGRSIYRQIEPLALNWQDQLLACLDEREQEIFTDLLNKLENRARDLSGRK